MEKKLYIEEVGEVLLKKSTKAKHINITLQPFKGVVVSVPQNVNFQSAIDLVHQKKSWIKRHRQKMIQAEEALDVEARSPLARLFANFEPWQRLVLAVLLFLNIAVCGCMALVVAGRVVFSF